MIKVKRALISVSDKTGILEFARALQGLGVEILSTGGTAKILRNAGVEVKDVSAYTGFPEILDGRVKTLHPAIHGGLLALRENSEHIEQLNKHKIDQIDMVVVNLYPFERVTSKKSVSLDEALDNIDIGGPAMLRSAAKNFKNVAVICNPRRYKEILTELDTNTGLLSDAVLVSLAVEVFEHTSRYDGVIYSFLRSRKRGQDFSRFESELALCFRKIQDLRYGENPHQASAFYACDQDSGLARMQQLSGKELSFNNILDLNAAIALVRDFSHPAAAVIKHNNPTGVAEDVSLARAFCLALSCDPVSAFGGIIGLNKKVDKATAEMIFSGGFMECVIAPDYDRSALAVLQSKKNLRLVRIKLSDLGKSAYDFKAVDGGLLLQEKDDRLIQKQDLKVVTKKKPTPIQMESLLFGFRVIKHIRSNAILLVKGRRTVGIGCGQTSRVESVALAIKKAGRQASGALLVSDAFFPKTDNVLLAAKAGIRAIIQTGGSIADQDVIKAADKAGLAMVFTGIRHFKH